MTENEKKLIQAKHRLEQAQNRNREKERKARTRRLIQEGAILEKVVPNITDIELDNLEDYLLHILKRERYYGRSDFRNALFFIPKGALIHHRYNRR